MEHLNIVKQDLMPVREQLESLLAEHWHEVAKNKHLMKLAPQVEKYAKLEAEGALLCLFARSGEVIVGYSINIITPHLHYGALTIAQNDVIFIHPVFRPSSLGLRLIKATEEACADAGAQIMLMHAKEDTPFAKILPRKGYGVQDIIYSKELRK